MLHGLPAHRHPNATQVLMEQVLRVAAALTIALVVFALLYAGIRMLEG